MEQDPFETEERKELIRQATEETDRLPWLYIADFRPGDILEIKTQRRTYGLRIIDPKEGLVNLLFFDGVGILLHQMTGKFHGSVINVEEVLRDGPHSALIKYSGLGVGFSPFILLPEGKAFILTPIQEISKDGKVLLPDFSKIPTREK